MTCWSSGLISGISSSRQPLAQHLVRPPAEHLLGGTCPPGNPQIAIGFDHRQRGLVEKIQKTVALSQPLFRHLPLGNIHQNHDRSKQFGLGSSQRSRIDERSSTGLPMSISTAWFA
jgi:hypothetical protein